MPTDHAELRKLLADVLANYADYNPARALESSAGITVGRLRDIAAAWDAADARTERERDGLLRRLEKALDQRDAALAEKVLLLTAAKTLLATCSMAAGAPQAFAKHGRAGIAATADQFGAAWRDLKAAVEIAGKGPTDG